MQTCKNCNKSFNNPHPYQKRIFCSKRCAAIYNNKHTVKRHKTKKCKGCNILIYSSRSYCPQCIKNGKHLRSGLHLSERTIKEVLYFNGANRYGVIRGHARNTIKSYPQKCCMCHYDKHVEACHINDIPTFPVDTKLSIVNSPSNLTLLCPNCHWEYHRGLITKTNIKSLAD